MGIDRFRPEDIKLFGDIRLADIANYIIETSVKTPNLKAEFRNGSMGLREFKGELIREMKPLIIERIAQEMGIANPASEEAEHELYKKYSQEKLDSIIDEAAEREIERAKK
jgi:tryptophanyl-tRNA synthetase